MKRSELNPPAYFDRYINLTDNVTVGLGQEVLMSKIQLKNE